ncbi:hypothetical protein TB2_019761 [Malus domestica]
MSGAYPGLYLFTIPSRFVRPVKNISIPSVGGQNIELIGPLEQVFMEIRCPDGRDGGRKDGFPATHEEIHPTGMLSVTETIDSSDQKKRSDNTPTFFKKSNVDKNPLIDSDGLPYVGQTIKPYEEYYSFTNATLHKPRAIKRKGTEPVIVDYVAIDGKKLLQKANIRFRHTRNPIIGDKFPSRMTIAMLLESVAAKVLEPKQFNFYCMLLTVAEKLHYLYTPVVKPLNLEHFLSHGGSLHGHYVDATPFASSKNANGETGPKSKTLVDELGELLKVRSTGTVDQITRQPITGRK